MYKYQTIPELIKTTEAAMAKPVERYGVLVYIDTDPDGCGNDMYIDPLDEKGLAIFRDFATKMAEHYKSLIP